MSHIELSVHLKPPLFMDAGVSFLARLTVYLKPSLFIDVSASFLMNVKFLPVMHCQ